MGIGVRCGMVVALLAAMVWAQKLSERSFPALAEFHFIRMEYTDLPQVRRPFGYSSRRGSGEGWWSMDWPDAEEHFTVGLARLTRVDAGEPRTLRLTDDRIFDHPWIYATQVGWWDLSDEETTRLGEYLMRGGFLVVDDFYGPAQWELFRRTMGRALPGRPIFDIEDSDSVMRVLYEIPEKDRGFIPGTRHLRRGPGGRPVGVPPPDVVPAWRGIYDDKGRLIVAINFNMDVADAWEYADWPEYPADMTTLAYRLGINYVVYAMTH
ncbi:MAG: DUF4159 domain-containing protein [Bryobacteraceae bacterium]